LALFLAQHGFKQFEFDQMNGGYLPDCYSSDHGHEPGPGRWKIQAIAETMSEVRKVGRQITKDFTVSMEDPQELLIPYLDNYFSRSSKIFGWPAPDVGARVVPAFAFVYHSRIRPFAIDIPHDNTENEFLLLATAEGFVNGMTMGTNSGWWAILDSEKEHGNILPYPEKLHPSQLKLLKSTMTLQAGAALPYLSYGKMEYVDQENIKMRRWTTTRWTGKETVEDTFAYPSVRVSAWTADGKRGFVFVNPTSETVEFEYDFSIEGQKPCPETTARIHSSFKPTVTALLKDLDSLKMPQYSTLLVEYTLH
jgi:hypothetical protein